MILKKLLLAAAIQRMGPGPGPGPDPIPSDPFWDDVLILAHYNTTTQLNDIKGHSLSRYGSSLPNLNSGAYKFDGASVRFTAEGQVLVYQLDESEKFGTKDFTIECFIFPSSVTHTAARAIISLTPNNHNVGGFSIALSTTGLVEVWDTTGTSTRMVQFPTPITASTWHHVMLSRKDGVMRLGLNGVVSEGVSVPSDYTTTRVGVGGNLPPVGDIRTFVGYIDEVRITLGVARYVSNFFPPTSPFLERAPGSVPQIGDYYNGGYYAGLVKNPDTGEMWRVLVSPDYPSIANFAWKSNLTETPGTNSMFDGLANTHAIIAAGIADHSAANACVSYSNDGFSDWYMPARDELELCYRNFSPTDVSNITGSRLGTVGGGQQGENPSSIPVGTAYTETDPPVTELANFVDGGANAFLVANHWTSTEAVGAPNAAIRQLFSTGAQAAASKGAGATKVRPVRRELYVPPPPPPPLEIGDYYNGGYYAGLMKNPDTGEMWRLILAPKSGESPNLVQWKTTRSLTLGTTSAFDGVVNTNAIITAGAPSHPAAKVCIDYANGGYDDWYLPARDEVELLYRNFKRTTEPNFTGTRNTSAGGGPQGSNNFSVPQGVGYTTTDPGQTDVAIFKQGGSQELPPALWSSTQGYGGGTNDQTAIFQTMNIGLQNAAFKDNADQAYTRPVRRELYVPPPSSED